MKFNVRSQNVVIEKDLASSKKIKGRNRKLTKKVSPELKILFENIRQRIEKDATIAKIIAS